MLRVIIDTNVFISGLLKGRSSRLIIEALQESMFVLIISPETLSELVGVIARPEFHNLITRETAEKLIETIESHAILVKPKQKLEVISEDPEDNRFLEITAEEKVDIIVSGDSHLLSLKKFRNAPIIPPSEFLKILKKE